MKNIRISDDVWNEIAKRGYFGETEDDVLRRVFGLNKKKTTSDSLEKNGVFRSRNKTKNRLSTRVNDAGKLVVDFQNGSRREWVLPSRNEKKEIRKVIEEASVFAHENDATIGQINAIRKALTDSGYHLTK
ncbi:MAG: hypothetical protein QY316_11665 [Thermodesulfobacteriota bacterium]|nr:MAG: hypothetical protein QY316_11665 [Thermodesulfobacteriota bacterium]